MFFIGSDFHFSHNRILEFERSKFDTIYDHDAYILKKLGHKLIDCNPKETDTFYFLGDFGMPNDTGHIACLRAMFHDTDCRTVAVLGNHDKKIFKEFIYGLFDEVYEYPIYISHRLVLSHFPVPVLFNDEPSPILNVHGHTHNSFIAGPNYLCASWAVAGYGFVSEKLVNNRLAKLPDYSSKFLYEPYAKNYVFTNKKRNDIIYDENGILDIEKSREAVKRQMETALTD